MNEEAVLREEICRVGRSLFERGYVHATAGNISVRVPEHLGGGYIITPTDACLGFLEPQRLARLTNELVHAGGDQPSKTVRLHRRIYDANPQAQCVLHTHSTHLVALTLTGVWSPQAVLPPITPYFVMKVGKVPLVPYAVPGDATAADAVGGLAAQPHTRAVLLERLGPVVWSDSVASASAVLEELEETARLWLLSGKAATPLDSASVTKLCERFGTHW